MVILFLSLLMAPQVFLALPSNMDSESKFLYFAALECALLLATQQDPAECFWPAFAWVLVCDFATAAAFPSRSGYAWG